MFGVEWLWAEARRGDVFSGFGTPAVTGVIAMAVSLALTPLVRRIAIRRGAIDDPTADDRRVHSEPTPRWGGLAIYAAVATALVAVLPWAYPAPHSSPFPAYLIGVLVLGGVLVAVGALDDVRQYSAKVQALVLLVVGIGIQFLYDPAGRVNVQGISLPWIDAPGHWLEFAPWVAISVTALYIFVVTKTMDTIDGVDGLAAGIAAIASCTLCVIAVYQGQPRVAIVTAALAGASIGFLRHNYNPAKIFMGTGGAQFLGFVLACVSVVGAMKTAAAVSILVPVLAFGVQIFDAAYVTIRRVLSGQPITRADKRHVHHTLMNQGLSQRQTVLVLYAVAIVLCGMLVVVVRMYG